MTAALLSLSIGLTIVFGIVIAVARFWFRTPIEFDPLSDAPGDWPHDGRRG